MLFSTSATDTPLNSSSENYKRSLVKLKYIEYYVVLCRFDRTLGGVEFQLRLRDHLAKLFDKQKKTRMDLYSNDRAMAKLFKEAGRLMKVLSANTQHVSQVRVSDSTVSSASDQKMRHFIPGMTVQLDGFFLSNNILISVIVESVGKTEKYM